MYYRTYTYISDFIHVLQSIYLSYRTYTGLSDLIRVLQNLYMYFRSYMYITELIVVTYSFAKVPVGTISRN